MPQGKLAPNTWLWTIAAAASLVWALIALLFASLGPHEYVPRVFSNYHVEHFAAFYVVTVLASAGLPRTRLFHIGTSLALMAVAIGIVRAFIPNHWVENVEDLVSDLSGVVCAIAPILVGRFRQIVAASDAQPPSV
jgi:hypothetical protein